MSLVPDAVRNLLDLLFPFYLVGHSPKPGYSLDRRQTEFADGTGIPLGEELDLRSADLRHEIGINDFAGAAGRAISAM